MNAKEQRNARAAAKARDVLEGRQIIEAKYMSEEQTATLGWSRRGLVCILDNGTRLTFQSDDEGNDAGAVYYQSKRNDVCDILPGLPV